MRAVALDDGDIGVARFVISDRPYRAYTRAKTAATSRRAPSLNNRTAKERHPLLHLL
jgi:hypothetical protein